MPLKRKPWKICSNEWEWAAQGQKHPACFHVPCQVCRFPTDFTHLANTSPKPGARQANWTELRVKRDGSHFSYTRPNGLLPVAVAARTGSPAHAEHRPCSYSSSLLQRGTRDTITSSPIRLLPGNPSPAPPRPGSRPPASRTGAAAGGAGALPGLRCCRDDTPSRACPAPAGSPTTRRHSLPRPRSAARGGSQAQCAGIGRPARSAPLRSVPFRSVPLPSPPPGAGGRVLAAHRKRRPAAALPWGARSVRPASTWGWAWPWPPAPSSAAASSSRRRGCSGCAAAAAPGQVQPPPARGGGLGLTGFGGRKTPRCPPLRAARHLRLRLLGRRPRAVTAAARPQPRSPDTAGRAKPPAGQSGRRRASAAPPLACGAFWCKSRLFPQGRGFLA